MIQWPDNTLCRIAATAFLVTAGLAPASAVGAPEPSAAFALPPDLPPALPATSPPDLPATLPDTVPHAASAGTMDAPRIPFQLEAGTILSVTNYRDPVVQTSGPGPDWSQRTDLRMFGHAALSDRVGVLTNIRLRTRWAEGDDYAIGEDSHLDVQELAVDVQATDWLTLEAGRINVRNGVATGFNPTDWFKNDSLVVSDSFDAVDRREDRLGTLVTQAVVHGDNAVFVGGYRLPVKADARFLGRRPRFHRPGPRPHQWRGSGYAKLTPLGSSNLSVTMNAILEPHQPGLGAEVSGAVSETLVLFGEWFGQRRHSLVDEARQTAPLPAQVVKDLGGGKGRRFLSQFAIGGTWSLPFSMVGAEDISVTAEYHFNQAGLTGDEMDAWFDAGRAGAVAPGPLWAVRSIATRRQEPLSRHQVFLRFSYNEILSDVDVGAIAFIAPEDGSTLVQADADAVVWDDVVIGLSAFTSVGDDESIFGSLPGEAGCRLSLSLSF